MQQNPNNRGNVYSHRVNIPIYNESSNMTNGEPSATGETRPNENLNTGGSSQTSGGEYFLEGESINQDGQ